jgi:hypothetical protein
MFCIVVVGCGSDLPKSALNRDIHFEDANVVPVLKLEHQPVKPAFFIRYSIKESKVFVECILSDISFRSDNHKKRGKLILSVDGKKTNEIDSPIFIIKGLSPGNHRITVEVVSLENNSYDLKREFNVSIP